MPVPHSFQFIFFVFFVQNCGLFQNEVKIEPTPLDTKPAVNSEKVCPSLSEQIQARQKYPYDLSASVPIYFVTSRQELPGKSPTCLGNYYSHKNDQVKYGLCEVSVPSNHSVGALDLDPDWEEFSANNQKNPNTALKKEKFFYAYNHKKIIQERFNQILGDNLEEELFIFVHGFNVSFEEAIVRAAQIQYDLKFPGKMVVFSWPSGSEEGLFNKVMLQNVYEENFANSLKNREAFYQFLHFFIDRGKKIHLMVHSMGHQLVLPAIQKIAHEIGTTPLIQELILNAPDYDAREFRNLMPELKKVSKRITLYCSPLDKALLISQKVNQAPRAGICERFDGVDVINVSLLEQSFLGITGLGHSYYASRALLTDIFQITLGLDAQKRLFLRRSWLSNATENYFLRP